MGMNAEERLLIDVALVALIIVIWVGWHHNRSDKRNNEPC